jgi:hypothetical protein
MRRQKPAIRAEKSYRTVEDSGVVLPTRLATHTALRLCFARAKKLGRSKKLFARNGASARTAQQAKSKIIKSIWIASQSWSWLLSPTSP